MKKLLLDTNVLLLYIVGNHLKNVTDWKRLDSFDQDDLKRVNSEAKSAQHVTLPNILTEATNLLGAGSQESFLGAAQLLLMFTGSATEIYKPSKEVMEDPIYSRLGLTDTAVAILGREKIRVITVDIELANRLSQGGVDVENLRHYKTPRHRTPSRKWS